MVTQAKISALFYLKNLQFKNLNYPKCLSIGTSKTINFPFVPNEKLMFLGVPIFNHFRVIINITYAVQVLRSKTYCCDCKDPRYRAGL